MYINIIYDIYNIYNIKQMQTFDIYIYIYIYNVVCGIHH